MIYCIILVKAKQGENIWIIHAGSQATFTLKILA